MSCKDSRELVRHDQKLSLGVQPVASLVYRGMGTALTWIVRTVLPMRTVMCLHIWLRQVSYVLAFQH